MKRREIILGPPGTGKTTELINRLDRAFVSGIEPEEVAYLAFTKKAAQVAISRSMKYFNFTRNRFPYFRTIHSLAFHENKIASVDVMRTEVYRTFGREYGWDFTASYDNLDDRPSYGNGLGDQLLRCYDLSRAKGISPEQEAVSGDYQFSEQALQFFVKQFETFKHKYGFLTFNDFLMRPVKLDVQLVIIDEAQDLTRLQWDFIRKSFTHVPEILIAGDDDQCIYQWSGADLSFFLNVDAKITQLQNSHRCKREIWKMCNRISDTIGQRYEKSWKPVSDGGRVYFEHDPFSIDLSTGEWLVMARKNRNLKRYYQMCMAAGRVFHTGQEWINRTWWFRGVRAYQALARGEKITDTFARYMTKVCPFAHKLAEYSEYEWKDFMWRFEGKPPWYEACTSLQVDQMTFMRKCLDRSDEDPDAEGQLRVSTIHASKGGEAENVLLDMRLDGIPLDQFRRDPDAERRVWYVGVSRAKTNLILTGSFKNLAVAV